MRRSPGNRSSCNRLTLNCDTAPVCWIRPEQRVDVHQRREMKGLPPSPMIAPASTVAPMSATVIPPPTAMGVAGLLFVESVGRSSKQRLKVGN